MGVLKFVQAENPPSPPHRFSNAPSLIGDIGHQKHATLLHGYPDWKASLWRTAARHGRFRQV